jgi:polysaccharide export outer membrane protein
MRAPGTLGRAVAVLLTVGGLAAAGCVHTGQAPLVVNPHAGPPIVVPPPGAVPTELGKVTLPEYVIEPPDVLRIEAYLISRPEDRKDEKDDKKDPKDARTGEELRSLPLQPVFGEYQVRPDGTVFLGIYGSVPVAGYTLRQAAMTIREILAKQVYPPSGVDPNKMIVLLDVTQYQSKRYYVILDGGGNGEQVTPFPVTGSETVLDALANVNGLHAVASKRNIWVARRCPIPGQPEQILPVDWVGITQHGVTATNWQVMPGDRIYVKAQRLVTIDTALARILNPVERLFGVTLLGATTVNQISGRGSGFGNNQ